MLTADSHALIAVTASNHGWTLAGTTPEAVTYTRRDRKVTVTFDSGHLASWTLFRPSGTTKTSEYLHKLLDLLASR